MAGVYLDGEQPVLWGMWVSPPARGRGLGRALAETVIGWARNRGLERLTLSASDAAATAERMYTRLGFARTGEARPLESDPALQQHDLVLDLHPEPIRVETGRLLLRRWEPDEFSQLHGLRSSEDVVRWLYDPPSTEEESRARLARRIGLTRFALTGDGIGFAVDRGGEVVGDASLSLTSAEHRQGEIGFIVHPDHQGHGYASEATRALVELGFGTFGLHRMVGRAEARNVASARVLEKAGMRLEAHLVENELVKGEWQSELVYAVRQSQSRRRK
jgi:RimJ/RimL family protein N-acetyltransferase